MERPTGANRPIEIVGGFPVASNPGTPSANENPGALAGATGALSKGPIFKTKEYRTRYLAARHLCLAIAACHEDEAVPILSAALSDLTAGKPGAPFLSLAAEAAFWADLASVAELKVYTLASFNRLPAPDQAAFLAHVQGGRRDG